MCKLKALANSRGSYPLADMETSDNTLDQVHMYVVNKRILITVNKRIHTISTYFLAAASDKCMRLLTSLYDIFVQQVDSSPFWLLTCRHLVSRTCIV